MATKKLRLQCMFRVEALSGSCVSFFSFFIIVVFRSFFLLHVLSVHYRSIEPTHSPSFIHLFLCFSFFFRILPSFFPPLVLTCFRCNIAQNVRAILALDSTFIRVSRSLSIGHARFLSHFLSLSLSTVEYCACTNCKNIVVKLSSRGSSSRRTR